MVTFLIIVTVALATLAIWQLVRVFEGTARLKGGDSMVPTDGENRYQSKMVLLFMIGFFSFFSIS